MFYQRTRLRFRCTGCGACCVGGTGYYVGVRTTEAHVIRTFLGLSPNWFRRRYLVRLDDGRLGLRLGADGRCPFLQSDLRCRVYPVRPGQCRSYPFWPEVLASKHSWLAEAKRCEGIGQGPVIPVRHMRACLALERSDAKPG